MIQEPILSTNLRSPEDPAMTKLTELSVERLDIPRQLPFMLSFNQWYANRPGSTYFIPVTEVASVYLNLLWSCSVMSTVISLSTPTTEMAPAGSIVSGRAAEDTSMMTRPSAAQ